MTARRWFSSSLRSRTLVVDVACLSVVLCTFVATPLHAERYLYDAPGRLVRTIYDDLSSIAYTYDANGNLTAVDTTDAGIAGDADGSGTVDAADVAAILQIALDGGEPYTPLADCNLDDVGDVLDLVCAVGAGSPVAGAPTLTLPDLEAMRGDSVGAGVSLTGVGGVARAAQLDVVFDPAAASVAGVAGGAALADHVLSTSTPEPGRLRIVVYSPTNAALGSGDLAEVSLDVDPSAPYGVGPFGIAGAVVAGPDATALAPLTLVDGQLRVYLHSADLSVVKTANPSFVRDGGEVTYTVAASNGGPDGVTGAHLSDLVPGELVAVTWNCDAAGGATCTAAGSGDIDDTLDLPAGSSASYTVLATVSALPGSFGNTAELTAPDDTKDAVAANDSSTAVVAVALFTDGFESGDSSAWSTAVTP